MSSQVMVLDDINSLRSELNKIPRAKLQFSKTVIDLLSSYNISVTGDLLGKLTLATCNEIVSSDDDVRTVWTN
ncbi:hypothetical protein QEJ31_06415 [Pigmentibacter sp. JX0631]|uniref:hypothetical protein n=1 Tax=Pigmentibacter sp. JX0631 TaxID=2976982 RepID=UPI0024695F08|nr:hypothetical protein [Pigmentibacter sp. JX0631]WGL61223.1 hypothetical protein QEJ31_06415 [Pigmentibacter sp. JX0631]